MRRLMARPAKRYAATLLPSKVRLEITWILVLDSLKELYPS